MTNSYLLSCILILVSCGHHKNSSNLDIVGGIHGSSNTLVKGTLPSTIGFIGKGIEGGICSASRVGTNTFLTAGHCIEMIAELSPITITLSNSLSLNARIYNKRIHPSYKSFLSYLTTDSDVAIFSLQYETIYDRQTIETFTSIGKLSYQRVQTGSKVTIAGFGCEEMGYELVAPPKFLKTYCKTPNSKKPVKFATSEISDSTNVLNPMSDRNFTVRASISEKSTGYAAIGDSGGPVFDSSGNIIGVNVALVGFDELLLYSIHSWLGFSDVEIFISKNLKDSDYYNNSNHTYTFPNGDVYTGAWLNGMRHGQGHQLYTDGKAYNGSWEYDIRSGYGEQIWSGSKYSTYKGNWRNDLPNGEGLLVYSDGLVYSGQLVNAKLEGQGTMSYQNGDSRSGRFVNNRREGEFKLVTADGLLFREIFSSDQRQSIEAQ